MSESDEVNIKESKNNISSLRVAKRMKAMIADSKDLVSASALVLALTSALGISAPVGVSTAVVAAFALKGLDAFDDKEDEDLAN